MEVLRRKRKQTVVLDEVGLIVNPLEDFMFYGGGKGGGGTKIVYVPQVQKETVVKNAPNAPKQEGASTMTEDDKPSDDETINGRNKTLGGTRKLAIPVTPSR